MEQKSLKGNVILVDAGYADDVAGKLAAYIGGSIGRDLPAADLAEWLVCCALDCCMDETDGIVHVIFVHTFANGVMKNFVPSLLADDIDGQAFRDGRFGEFVLYSLTDEHPENATPLMEECIRAAVSDKGVKRLAVVCDDVTCIRALSSMTESMYGGRTCQMSMEQAGTHGVEYVPVGYSLLHAMDVSPDEI